MDGAFNIEIDQSTVTRFFGALDQYVEYRHEEEGKGFGYLMNRTAQNVAGWAAHFTHRASDSALRQMLGQPALALRTSKKTGNIYRVKAPARTTNDAGRILAARMRRAGKNPQRYSAPEWQEKVRKFVGRTLRSTNFMRSGWIRSYRELTMKVHQSAEIDMSAAFGRRNEDERGEFAKHAYPALGGAFPAQPSPEGVTVEIFNTAVNPRNRTSWTKGLEKYGRIGLERALAFKTDDMLKYLDQELDRRAREGGL